jgi:hypothetical protein
MFFQSLFDSVLNLNSDVDGETGAGINLSLDSVRVPKQSLEQMFARVASLSYHFRHEDYRTAL